MRRGSSSTAPPHKVAQMCEAVHVRALAGSAAVRVQVFYMYARTAQG